MHVDTGGAWGILLLCTVLIAGFLAIEHLSPRRKDSSLFYSHIWTTAIWGGTLAFFLPIALDLGFGPNDDGRVLRQLLLYTTGGVLGVITLSETRRKNDLEKSKFNEQQIQFRKQLEAQKENLNSQLEAQKETLNSQLEAQKETLNSQLQSQKDNLESQLKAQHDNLELQLTSQEKKDKRDHTRQVRAERRSRYTTAVEQLAHEEAAIRLGGVYTLMGLVDEWLTDTTLDKKSRQKEGQVIINNLCAYIRSPFLLAEKRETLSSLPYKSIYVGDFIADKAKLAGEQEVRHAFFAEISKRLTNKDNKTIYRLWDNRLWDKFEYDFSKAPIFYSLKNLTFRNPDFSDAVFSGEADFRDCVFKGGAKFNNAVFNGDADFSCSKPAKITFEGPSDFSGASFMGKANFKGTVFDGEAIFSSNDSSWTIFNKETCFSGSSFKSEADFAKAFFKGDTNFSTTFEGEVGFFDATFEHKVKFNNSVIVGHADFEYTSFMMDSEFQKTEFHGGASFLIGGGPHTSSLYPFKGNANFTEAYFAKTATFADRYFDGDMIFTGVIFEGSAYFEDGRTQGISNFDRAYFVDSTRFSNHIFGSSSTFNNACFATGKSHEFFSINVQNLPLGSVPRSPDNSWPQNQIPIGSRYGESWDFEERTFTDKSPQAA